MNDPQTFSQLRWQCRRGMLELDLLFDRFLTMQYDTLSNEALANFSSLLTQSDVSLYAWFFDSNSCIPEEFRVIIKQIKQGHT